MARKNTSIQARILTISTIGILVLAVFMSVMNILDTIRTTQNAIEEKSKAVVMTAESTREEMAKKIELGVIRSFPDLVAEGNREILLSAVPIITAINVAKKQAVEANYEFRVPKINPRNPENEPTELELAVLNEFDSGNLGEKIIVEKEVVRYFRPIRLTQECLLCHGDPAGTPDPVGGIKEGWKVGEVHGAFEIISSLRSAAESRRIIILRSGVGTVVLIGIIFLVLFLITKKMLKPLSTYMADFEAASQGDLTVHADVSSTDEIGRLSGFFNKFIDSLNSMIGRIKNVTDTTRNISGDLAATSEETASALVEIRTNTENMKNKIVTLDGEVSSSTAAARVVKSFITEVGNLISSQAAAIDESSASIEEISSTINNMAKSAEEKMRIANALEKTALDGEAEMEETVKVIKKVAESANIIMDMTTVIQNIAAQTNLLAMNAAIEAAHAGEAGRGFAVVADEIRKLAESSGSNAKVITKSLKEVTGYIHISEQTTGKSGKAFNDIVVSVKNVAHAMLEMKSATDELSVGSRQIVEALTSLIDITEDVKSSYGEMDQKMEGIASSMSHLSMISSDTKNGMEEVTIGIKEIFDAVHVISESGTKNSDSVKELEALIAKFKVKS